jgi:hypothetical protein
MAHGTHRASACRVLIRAGKIGGVSAGSLGARLSRHRRHRIGYLALLRRSSRYAMRTWLLRVIALVIIATLSVGSSGRLLAIALCLIASLGTFLLWLDQWHLRQHTRTEVLAHQGLPPQLRPDRR